MTVALACVMPALDAAATLPAVARGLRAALPAARLIAVDDGSGDSTARVAASWCDCVLHFDENRGKGAALRAGIAEALSGGAAVVVTIDADGQHDPAFAPLLVEALEHADLAVGCRARHGTAMPWRRRVTNALASAAVGAIAAQPIADAQSGYRAMRRAVVEHVRADGDRYEFETDFLIRAARAGFRIANVPVSTRYGPPSHFRGVRDAARVVRTIWKHRGGATD